MEHIEQVFAIIALVAGGPEITLASNLTFTQCTDRVEFYMQAANNLKGTDIAIMCTSKGGYFVSF